MIKLYNLKVFERSGGTTYPSLNLFRLASDLDKVGCTAREFDTISNLPVGETFVANGRAFEVKRYA